MKKKGQAAMEFLMTYGWALLVVLLAIGSLSYFGVLNFSRFIPESCTLVPGLSCVDFKVGVSSITLIIRNGMGTDLYNFSVKVSTDDVCMNLENWTCNGNTCNNISGGGETLTLKNDEIVTLVCYNSAHSLTSKSRYDQDLTISYKKIKEGLTHKDIGQLISKVSPTIDVYGCTDQYASNHNTSSTIDDGSCEYLPFIISFSVNDISNQLEFYFPEGTPLNFEFVLYDHYPSQSMEAWFTSPLANLGSANIPYFCIPHSDPLSTYSCGGSFNCPGEGPCEFTVIISNVPGLSEGEYDYNIMLTQQPGTSEFTDLDFNINFYNPNGCTDPEALNYDPEATVDDGSCEYTEDEDESNGMPELFWYNQSTSQGFYFFRNVTIGGENVEPDDWVASFNGNVAVGARQWNISNCGGGVCDLPVMGSDGGDYSGGYLTPGDFPTFKIYDASEDAYYDAIPSENLSWHDFAMYVIDSLQAIIYGCTDPNAINYNYLATDDDNSCEY